MIPTHLMWAFYQILGGGENEDGNRRAHKCELTADWVFKQKVRA